MIDAGIVAILPEQPYSLGAGALDAVGFQKNGQGAPFDLAHGGFEWEAGKIDFSRKEGLFRRNALPRDDGLDFSLKLFGEVALQTVPVGERFGWITAWLEGQDDLLEA